MDAVFQSNRVRFAPKRRFHFLLFSIVSAFTLVVVAAITPGVESTCEGQQVVVEAPFTNSSSSFFEHYGIHWGFSRRWNNGFLFFDNGGAGGGIPPFGGFDPNSVARFGFGRQSPDSQFFFNFSAGQGSRRSLTGVAPSLTFSNGVPAYLFDGQTRPFVTGIVPVVGGWPVGMGWPPGSVVGVQPVRTITPLEERIARLNAGEGRQIEKQAAVTPIPSKPVELEPVPALKLSGAARSNSAPESRTPGVASNPLSTAERGDVSLAEIRRQQKIEEDQMRAESAGLFEKAEAARREGKMGQARIFYRQAAERATGQRRRELLELARTGS